MNYTRMEEQLILHEGIKLKPYYCTAGKLTWGVGYNIDDRGLGPLCKALGRTVTLAELNAGLLTRDDALTVLRADIKYFETRVRKRFPEYARLDEVRQRVVIDLAFNLGARLIGFKKAIAKLKLAITGPPAEASRWFAETALELVMSMWFTQVGDGPGGRYDRAERLCDMMRTGKDWTK